MPSLARSLALRCGPHSGHPDPPFVAAAQPWQALGGLTSSTTLPLALHRSHLPSCGPHLLMICQLLSALASSPACLALSCLPLTSSKIIHTVPSKCTDVHLKHWPGRHSLRLRSECKGAAAFLSHLHHPPRWMDTCSHHHARVCRYASTFPRCRYHASPLHLLHAPLYSTCLARLSCSCVRICDCIAIPPS